MRAVNVHPGGAFSVMRSFRLSPTLPASVSFTRNTRKSPVVPSALSGAARAVPSPAIEPMSYAMAHVKGEAQDAGADASGVDGPGVGVGAGSPLPSSGRAGVAAGSAALGV